MALVKKTKNEIKRRERLKERRKEIIAPLYKHGWTYREIRDEVKSCLDLKAYSLATVKKDIDEMLEEWREQRITDFDKNLTAELMRIDEIIKEAWEAWEKSKEDYTATMQRQRGVPTEGGEIATIGIEKTNKDERACGDPRYLDVIDKQLKERRKILGLYAPEKHDMDYSFSQWLMETGVEEEIENYKNEN